MDPTEAHPRRNMSVAGEPGSPEERHLCRLSSGMTLEGNRFASTALDTLLPDPICSWPTSEFTHNCGGHFPSQAPALLNFSLLDLAQA